MVTKEQVKQKIDVLPDYIIEQVYVFIGAIQPKPIIKKRMRAFELKGQFDHLDIRASAYE